MAYRHPARGWSLRNRCGLARAEAFAKARWKRDGWIVRGLAQRHIGGPSLVWRAVQHRSDPDVAAMGQRAWLGPWQPVGPPWTSYVYAEDPPEMAGQGRSDVHDGP